MAKPTVNNTLESLKQMGSVSVGLAAGKLTAERAQGFHPIAGPAVGSVLMGALAVVAQNKHLKNIAIGAGAVNFLMAIKNATAGKTGLFSVVNSYTPSLSGMRGFSGMRGLGNYSSAAQLGIPESAAKPAFSAGQLMGAN